MEIVIIALAYGLWMRIGRWLVLGGFVVGAIWLSGSFQVWPF